MYLAIYFNENNNPNNNKYIMKYCDLLFINKSGTIIGNNILQHYIVIFDR